MLADSVLTRAFAVNMLNPCRTLCISYFYSLCDFLQLTLSLHSLGKNSKSTLAMFWEFDEGYFDSHFFLVNKNHRISRFLDITSMAICGRDDDVIIFLVINVNPVASSFLPLFEQMSSRCHGMISSCSSAPTDTSTCHGYLLSSLFTTNLPND